MSRLCVRIEMIVETTVNKEVEILKCTDKTICSRLSSLCLIYLVYTDIYEHMELYIL